LGFGSIPLWGIPFAVRHNAGFRGIRLQSSNDFSLHFVYLSRKSWFVSFHFQQAETGPDRRKLSQRSDTVKPKDQPLPGLHHASFAGLGRAEGRSGLVSSRGKKIVLDEPHPLRQPPTIAYETPHVATH
jgi:hypothetical protein